MASNIRQHIDLYKVYRHFGLDTIKYYEPNLDGNKDSQLIKRAIYKKNIPTLKPSKLDYENIAEFKIHKLLVELQNEFMEYDLRYKPVMEWFLIRYKNCLFNINQIRERYWYFKKLDV